MATLEELREKLDGIDDQIAKLYEERMKVCEDVGRFKVGAGRKVFDRQREHEKLLDVASKVNGEFNKKGIQELYAQLMSMSRKLQYQQLVEAGALGRLPFIEMELLDKQNVRVVFQGVEGAYSQAAMKKYFPDNENNFHVTTFREAMEAIEEGAADFAVLPGTTLSQIERVYSKAEALMQTSRFLEKHGDWQQISVSNTAAAAKKVLKEQDHSQAAVCSAYAAQVYGLSVLAEDINDETNNVTRFIIVTNQKIFTPDASKISICFELPHQSGSLYQILSHFIYNDLNMTKIESRPVEGKSWEYRFFVDFEGNLEQPGVKNAIRGLREEARNLKILGNY